MGVRLLGPLELQGVDGTVAIGAPKERALLAYLALHVNEGVSESALIDALWPEDPPRTAARTLQSYLSRLRKRLADVDPAGERLQLSSYPGGWRLDAAPDALDTSTVDGLVARARGLAEVGDPVGAALTYAEAVRWWRGPALAEFSDTTWAIAATVRLEELRLQVIEERIDAELACGRHAALVGDLDALCSAHPLRERFWGQRMLALYRAGRQADALRAYQELRRRLGEELGIEPSPALSRIEQQILTQDEALDTAAAPPSTGSEPSATVRSIPPVLAGLRERAFVGRTDELAKIRAAFARARGGHLEVLLLAGEPGIGKTALAVEHAIDAWHEGATVLFGRCDEEALAPFQPFVEALGDLVDVSPPDELRRQLGAQAADLALLLPDLGRVMPEVAHVVPTGADTERYRLFEVVPSFLRAVAGDAPVLLVLDDLHWADRPTLQLLQHLIRRAAGTPMLVLGTYRDTDLVRTHPMAAALADMRRANLVERVVMRGLTRDDVRVMVTPTGKADGAGAALAEALWRESEGSPLFLREIVRYLVDTGAAVRTDDGGLRPERRIDQLAIPEGVREVIGRRLTRLSDAANGALATGAVLGRELDIRVLERLTDLDADALLEALEEAVTAGVLAEVPGQSGRYAFTHALVRQALYDELTITRRVRMHQRVGAALEEVYGQRDGHHLAEIAFHYAQAAVGGTAEKAIDYGRRAGEFARSVAAHEEAIRHFASALEVAEDVGADDAVRADLLLAMADCTWRSGGPREAHLVVERALTLDLDPEQFARAALAYAGGGVRGWWVAIGRADDRAIALLGDALERIGTEDSAQRARLLVTLAKELAYVADAETQREALTSDAVAMARRVEDPATLAFTLVDAILASFAPGTATQRAASAFEAQELATALGDVQLAGHAALHGAVALAELDRIRESQAAFEAAGALLEPLRDPAWHVLSPTYRTGTAIHEGRLFEARLLTGETFRNAQELRDPNGLVTFSGGLVTARVYEGDVDDLLDMTIDAVRAFPVLAEQFHNLRMGLMSYTEAGEEARAVFDELGLGAMAELPHNLFWLYGTCAVARGAWRIRHEAVARVLYDLLLPFEAQNPVVVNIGWGPVSIFLGWCSTILSRFDDAERHFEDAIERCDRNGWRVPGAEARAGYAAMLVERDGPGDHVRADVLVEDAAAVAHDVGLTDVIAETVIIRARLRGDPVPESAAPSAARGTRRDRAKAALARGGRAVVARWTRGDSDEDLVRQFGSPLAQRAVFAAMAKAFQPARAFGLSGDIVFGLEAPPDALDPSATDWWTVEIRGRRALARRGESDDPAAVLHLSVPDFIRLCSAEVNAVELILEGRLQVSGDVMLTVRLPDLFGLGASTSPGAG